jgi:predicted transcriptional regulator of viral defense system
MKWTEFFNLVSELPFFDLETVVQVTGKNRAQARVKLHRWSTDGRVIGLRRGLYTLADPYRKVELPPLQIANEVYSPSYLSSLWALNYYGLIPDTVNIYQSVTPRVTRMFENPFGRFAYSTIKQSLFWGFETRKIGGASVFLAHPEKALLDSWYLSKGEWTLDRLVSMRFQQLDLIDTAKLASFAERWSSPRITRSTERFESLILAEREFERIP